MTETVKQPRRWMTILLVASLGLNLLVAGVLLGAVLRFRGDHVDVPPGFGPALFRALPETDRKALRDELFDEHRRGARQRAQDFAELGEALRAVPFDPVLVENVLKEQAATTALIQSNLQKKWLSRVTKMTDAERKAYADRLEQVVKDRRSRKPGREH